MNELPVVTDPIKSKINRIKRTIKCTIRFLLCILHAPELYIYSERVVLYTILCRLYTFNRKMHYNIAAVKCITNNSTMAEYRLERSETVLLDAHNMTYKL